MPGLKDLEERLAVLRRQVALGSRGGYTALELLQLLRDCQCLWSQIETCRREQLTSLVPQELAGTPNKVA